MQHSYLYTSRALIIMVQQILPILSSICHLLKWNLNWYSRHIFAIYAHLFRCCAFVLCVGERKCGPTLSSVCSLCNYQLDFISHRNNKSLHVVEDLDPVAVYEQSAASVALLQSDTSKASRKWGVHNIAWKFVNLFYTLIIYLNENWIKLRVSLCKCNLQFSPLLHFCSFFFIVLGAPHIIAGYKIEAGKTWNAMTKWLE